ncbi:JAB domain-containing protein [Caryophanon tenue]|uniref:JAB domain-containing protein n=1 Tax=Caryophanon tenue TaxID=33978 RepID=UPI001FE0AAB8|nr:JAB domain-containing protein [Caryophanon tenue]
MQHNDHTLENQMEANAAAFILSRGVFPISDCGFKQSQTYEEERIYEIVRLKAKFRKLPKKYLSKNLEDYPVRSPADFAHIAMKFIGDDDREIFLVACLSTKNKIQSLHRCQIGLLNASLVTPREVFKTAFLQNAVAIIVAHNHPSQVLLSIV